MMVVAVKVGDIASQSSCKVENVLSSRELPRRCGDAVGGGRLDEIPTFRHVFCGY